MNTHPRRREVRAAAVLWCTDRRQLGRRSADPPGSNVVRVVAQAVEGHSAVRRPILIAHLNRDRRIDCECSGPSLRCLGLVGIRNVMRTLTHLHLLDMGYRRSRQVRHGVGVKTRRCLRPGGMWSAAVSKHRRDKRSGHCPYGSCLGQLAPAGLDYFKKC